MAEAAGLALGVASLLIAAIESYRCATTFFGTIKKYPRKLREAIQTLRMQELCFRKANEQILRHCVDAHEARKMLRDAEHPAWRDPSVSSRYIDLLGGDQNGFEAAISLICDSLDAVRRHLEEFVVHPKTSITVARKQLRFAFERSRIQDSLQDLTEKTQNFIALTNLVTAHVPSSEELRSKLNSWGLRKVMGQFAVVKSTAADLYGALESACVDHDAHQAYLSLSPACSDTRQIRFTLAFGQLALSPLDPDFGANEKPLWLTIESSGSGTIENVNGETDGLRQMVTTLKRTFACAQDDCDYDRDFIKDEKVKPPQRQRNTSSSSGSTTLVLPPPPPPTTFINLCKHRKICRHLAQFRGLTLPSDQAVGYLEKSLGSKHVIYLDRRLSQRSAASVGPSLKSLQDILKESDDDNADKRFSLRQRISLAGQLARAVLHFHKTAWLQDTLDSQIIMVRRRKVPSSHATPDAGADSRLEVFATTNIHSPASGILVSSTWSNPLVIRNRLLFSLGVVLLELVYEKPLAAMTDPIDRVGTEPCDVPYRTAIRLSKRLSSKWGPKYAETVRKCLHCDFGQGFDLGQNRLQEALYWSVICELETLAESLG
ncbi:uncharacterized protein PV07_07588 [Cladophialophora immunda]|uniref:DUF7580 domain-containing protein n=1 Tax=Cladophialophora immunda TaxID=569365 RepID=A0A0D2CBX2_9EURO|nr:uncharacterized protein PV07_07588 [Cladophialophora immunda]KIW27890.1 hypothetical protein PV07_07588 [Cladophialophora immunda]OQV01026.1 hypothetical protein CLAIMM_06445 [Cladophialophora immunda]